MRKLVLIGAVVVAGTAMISCSKPDSGVSTAKYNKLVNEFNENVREHNQLVRQNNQSDSLLIETGRLVSQLDVKASEVRAKTKSIRDGLSSYRNAEVLKTDMKSLDELVQEALAIVGKLEEQTSTKNINQIVSNSNQTIKDSALASYKARTKLAGLANANLSGLRDLFLSQYNDAVDIVNLRLREMASNTTVAPAEINPAREGNLIPENQSPIVTGLSGGGRATGTARDSLTGRPIPNAFVGFKRRPESRDYFYQTQTDNIGQYQSPYLMPGTYYVDIRREGYIRIESQPMQIRRGIESQENLAMTEPLGEGVFRITMSWSDEKVGAVKDVDSYLSIPDASEPLGFRVKGLRYHGAFLDRDDTDWSGPETITIHNLQSGTYVYYVNNYNVRNDRQALGNSQVRVKLYKGQQLLQNFEVPAGTGVSYELFRIENGEVKITGKFNDQLYSYR